MHRLVPFACLAALATWPVYPQDQTRGRVEGVKDHGTQEMFLPGSSGMCSEGGIT